MFKTAKSIKFSLIILFLLTSGIFFRGVKPVSAEATSTEATSSVPVLSSVSGCSYRDISGTGKVEKTWEKLLRKRMMNHCVSKIVFLCFHWCSSNA